METIETENESSKMVEKGSTMETIKPPKTVSIVDKPKVHEIPKVKTMKTIGGNSNEKPEVTKMIDCRPKVAPTIETMKSTGTTTMETIKTTTNSGTSMMDEGPETIKTIEPKTTKNSGTTKTIQNPETIQTTESTKPKTTRNSGTTTDMVETIKTPEPMVEDPEKTSSEPESDFVVIKREEVERAVTSTVPKVKPDLGLIPVKTNDWSSIFEEEDEYYNLIEAAKKAQQRPEIKIDQAVEADEVKAEENVAPNVRKFMEWEDKVLQEMKEERGWDELPTSKGT